MEITTSKATHKAVELYKEILALDKKLESKRARLEKLVSKLNNTSFCKYALITTAIDKGTQRER